MIVVIEGGGGSWRGNLREVYGQEGGLYLIV